MSGFTYNGIHSSEFSVDYIPNAEGRWFADPEYDLYSTDIAWHNGGYDYGNAVKIRDITVPCFFEEITNETREKIRRWLGRNTYGELIFDDRPFVKYYVRPAKVVPGSIYNDGEGLYSGTFTVTFHAADPFGYLTRKCNTAQDHDDASDYCGIIDEGYMPDEPTPSTTNFQVYNPGTEAVGMTILVSGTTDNPIRFMNNTNGTRCIFENLPAGNLTLDINGDTGFCKVYVGSDSAHYSNGYAYHDRGIVRLEPCWTEHNIQIVKTGVDGVMPVYMFYGTRVTDEWLGARIIFNNAPGVIGTVQVINKTTNEATVIVNDSQAAPQGGTCVVSRMNRIQIMEQNLNGDWVTPTSLEMTSLSIDYRPRLL